MMYKIDFPPPASYTVPGEETTGPWGLSEFLTDRCFALPENFFSTEDCTKVLGLMEKFAGLRGGAQRGRAVTVTREELDFVVRVFALGLSRFVGQVGVIPQHLIVDMAIYARALHTAEPVKEVTSRAEGALA